MTLPVRIHPEGPARRTPSDPAFFRANPPSRRAFSLLELLAVLLLISLLTALVAPAIGAASQRDRERAAMADLVRALRLERIEAVRSMRARRIDILVEGDAVTLLGSFTRGEAMERERVVEPFPLEVREAGAGEWTVVFEADGRTTAPPVSWAGARGSDRVWVISFDRLSGDPSGRLRSGEEEDATEWSG